MSSLLQSVFAVSLMLTLEAAIITPNSDDGTTQIYNTELLGEFQSEDISCNTAICNVICDLEDVCINTTIDASLSDQLILTCTKPNSCKGLKVTHSPQSIADIKCDNSSSCSNTDFNFTNTLAVNINCSYYSLTSTTSACHSTIIRAEATQTVTVECSRYGCMSANIYVNNTLNTAQFNFIESYSAHRVHIFGYYIVNGLTVSCNEQYSCSSAEIYCPYESLCNIQCGSTKQDACSGIDVWIENKEKYNYLNIECDNTVSDSCSGTDIVCADTGKDTRLEYSNSKWGCSDFMCCPIIEDTFTCPPNVDCYIDCSTFSTQSCSGWIVDGTASSSLTINCSQSETGILGGYGCEGTKIKCPNQQSSSCQIICDKFYSCSESTIMVPSVSMDTLIVDCSGQHACESATLVFDFKYVNTLNLTMKCIYASILFGNNINVTSINDANIDMECSNCLLDMSNIEIGNFNIDCDECDNIKLDLIIKESVTVSCNYRSSCKNGLIDLLLLDTVEKTNIYCQNIGISAQQQYATCGGATFNIYSTNLNSNHSVSATCNQYDCYNTSFSFTNISQVTMNCDEPYSCEYFTLVTTHTELLQLSCGNESACYYADIFCAYNSENACNIECANKKDACRRMDIFVDDWYTINYLNLMCPDPNSNIDSCSWISVKCNDQSGSITSSTSLISTSTETTCYPSDCCPFHIPTISTTSMTTISTTGKISNESTSIPTTGEISNESTSITTAISDESSCILYNNFWVLPILILFII
eukprot:495777_1